MVADRRAARTADGTADAGAQVVGLDRERCRHCGDEE
jgi:hypothetical protein